MRPRRSRIDEDPNLPKRPVQERFRELLPDIWALVKPRRGLLLFGLFLMVINRLMGLVLPSSTKYLIDDVIGKHQTELLVPLVSAVALATLIQGITSFSLTQIISKAGQRLIAEMRVRVQSHVGRLSVSYYDANKSGTLVSRIMTDVEGIRNLVGTGLIELIGGLFTAVLAFLMLIRISPQLTGIILVIVVTFTVVLTKAFSKVRPIFRERGKITSEVSGRLTESLSGIRVVKGYHAEEREEQVFAAGAARILENVFKSLTAVSTVTVASTVLMGLVGALVMFLGTRQILAGELTLGGFVTFTVFLGFLIAPMVQIANIGTQLTEAFAGLERTREVLREKREDDDPERTLEIGPIHGDVRFENVTFSYEKGKPVLHDLSFDASAGTVTALVGPSGSGKSTIIGLIAAFHRPDEGVVLVDETDLSKVKLSSYRTQIGVVLQETFLFDGSIRENVAFAKPNATEEEILAACQMARVDEFAIRMEKQYDTVVGERGVKLSGGQRQRVSIARALLANPRILILDEATSSLDSESEALIQEALERLMKGRTTFVIAHRLSTIRKADQILVVEEGRITEQGTHQELLQKKERYWDLYTRQHGIESNLFLMKEEEEESDSSSSVPDTGFRSSIQL